MVQARKRGGRAVPGSGGKVIERDLGWAEIKARAAELKGSKVKVGILQSAAPHRASTIDAAGADLIKSAFSHLSFEGGAPTGKEIPMADLATVHEYGAPERGIPQRSFIGSTIDEQGQEIAKLGTRAARRMIDGKITVQQVLGIVGTKTAALIQQKIVDGPFAPNAPLTIRLKGSDKPLIDTGQLRQSISYEIVPPSTGGKE